MTETVIDDNGNEMPLDQQYKTYFRGHGYDPRFKDIIKSLLRWQNRALFAILINMLPATLENLHADESKIDLSE